MAKASLILLLILGTSCSIQAKFVNKVLPNQFEFELEERGTKFTQKIRFEEGGNLRITEVPDHNDITGATYIFDKSTVCNQLTVYYCKGLIISKFLGIATRCGQRYEVLLPSPTFFHFE